MKGIMEEMLGFLIIVFAALLIGFFFYGQSSLKGGEVSGSIREKSIDEASNMALSSLFNNKLEIIEKPYIEVIIDSILQSDNKTFVYYGTGIGTIKNKEVVDPLFDYYLGKNHWKLYVIVEKNKSLEFGNLTKRKRLFSYERKIPVPPDQLGKVVLYVG
ncbi:MAG: hypothetical protein J7J92_03475 [Candidatus Aenigmarchaeota archaeon]|nr:hypothetical protein [Candidatus Aenigmarchaeota archaeon]